VPSVYNLQAEASFLGYQVNSYLPENYIAFDKFYPHRKLISLKQYAHKEVNLYILSLLS
jgi:hypothetical protein